MTLNMKIDDAVDDGLDDGIVSELSAGTTLLHGQYTITRFLSTGGFGITYLAKDSLDREVVIKECYADAFCRRSNSNVSARSRAHEATFKTLIGHFVKEAQSMSKLVHPNIVGVHQVFEENDTAYMAIDYVDGKDLLEILEESKQTLNPDQIISMTRKLLSAVSYIHEHGLLHRDISPDNILLDKSGEPILIDFGAARENLPSSDKKQSALHVVKDGYSPQELYISGSDQGPWSDLYSLAASLYHVIKGEAPLNGQNRLVAIAEQRPDPYVPLAGNVKGYTPGFLEAIDMALITVANKRLQSASEWLDMLDNPNLASKKSSASIRLVENPSQQLDPLEDFKASATQPRKSGGKLVIAALAVTAIGAGGYYTYSKNQTTAPAALINQEVEVARVTEEQDLANAAAEEKAASAAAAEQEATRLAAQAEAEAAQAEAEAAQIAAQTEAARLAEEARIAAAEQAALAATEAEEARKVAEQVAQRQAAEAEAAEVAAQTEAARLAEEVEIAAAEQAAEAAAEAGRKAAEQEALRQAAEAEAAEAAEQAEIARLAEEARIAAEEEAAQAAIIAEAGRRAAEQEALRQAEQAEQAEIARIAAEEKAAQAAIDAEAGRQAAEEEAIRQAAQAEAAQIAAQAKAADKPASNAETNNAIIDATFVMSGPSVKLPFVASKADPAKIGSVADEAPTWIKSGHKIVSVNSVPVQSIRDVPRAIKATALFDAGETITVDLGIQELNSETTTVRSIELQTMEEIALLNGMSFHSQLENGTWTTTVAVSAGGRPDELQVGDVIVASTADNVKIDEKDGLSNSLTREIANGATQINFVVRRDGEMWFASLSYGDGIAK